MTIDQHSKNKLVLLILFCLLSQAFSEDCSNIPRIPSYLGRGYDIVLGNPLSSGVDPGFRYDVISFDYSGCNKTEDNKFLVPKGISTQKAQSCSFKAEVNQYRGTQSYQNELKTKVSIGGGYDGVAFQAAFSASVGYTDIETKTHEQETVIYQATSQCENYKLALDTFKTYNVDQSLFNAIQKSYENKNWDNFIRQYGTHYVYEVLFGGRAIQDLEFTRSSVSELKQNGVDIGAAAKAGYAGFYGEASTDVSISESEKQQFESSKKKVSNYYIGGEPPRTGNIVDWEIKVRQHPMPIDYKILPLSDIFNGFPNKTKEWIQEVKKDFYNGINKYCDGKCIMPSEDVPLPSKKPILYTATFPQDLGIGVATGGFKAFDYNQHEADWQVTKVIIKTNNGYIGGIQLQLSDLSEHVTTSPFFGPNSGTQEQYTINPERQFISQIQLPPLLQIILKILNFGQTLGDQVKHLVVIWMFAKSYFYCFFLLQILILGTYWTYYLNKQQIQYQVGILTRVFA